MCPWSCSAPCRGTMESPIPHHGEEGTAPGAAPLSSSTAQSGEPTIWGSKHCPVLCLGEPSMDPFRSRLQQAVVKHCDGQCWGAAAVPQKKPPMGGEGALMANAASALRFVAGRDRGGNPAGLGKPACSVSHGPAWGCSARCSRACCADATLGLQLAHEVSVMSCSVCCNLSSLQGEVGAAAVGPHAPHVHSSAVASGAAGGSHCRAAPGRPFLQHQLPVSHSVPPPPRSWLRWDVGQLAPFSSSAMNQQHWGPPGAQHPQGCQWGPSLRPTVVLGPLPSCIVANLKALLMAQSPPWGELGVGADSRLPLFSSPFGCSPPH